MAGGWQMDEIEDVPSVSVKQGESVELRVGGPLSQKVEVTRSGNTLMLAHAVQGIGKEGYSNEKRYESPPEFTVYRGDTAVASGQFEYG
ncbi:MAG: hypothetical protein HYV26_18445 [Candidatus Hydrogenedentes bacterium]|nr:hypothetical protein [Candidatus Hydrogenedentota bacterium]